MQGCELGDTAFHKVFMGVIETVSGFHKDFYGDVTPMMKASVRIILRLLRGFCGDYRSSPTPGKVVTRWVPASKPGRGVGG